MAGLEVIASPLLSAALGVRHGFFSRLGGVSQGIYAALNAGPGSSDDRAHVAENRRRAAQWLGVTPERLLTAYQIHSADALTVAGPFGAPAPQGDALVTREAGLAVGALAADCAPVLIADPKARVAAAVHAGWKGALAGVVAAAVDAMTALGAEPDRMVAAVGPCIGPRSYEVGLDFLERFVSASSAYERHFADGERPDKRLFDLPGFVLDRLGEAGVASAEWTGGDTYADAERFYSNRRALHRDEPDYGRLLSAILLTDDQR